MFEQNPKFDLVSLCKLASSYLGEEGREIGIAGFQRNAVWREPRIEDLWDSLLCRFPIGSILLASYSDFSDVGFKRIQINRAAPYTDTLVDDRGVDYIVVDGQQRLNAIALGFLPFEPQTAARLWVSLNVPSSEKSRVFDFFLCTRENPFGWGLDKDARRKALESIKKEGFDDNDLRLEETYPYRASLAVPFVEFCQVLQKTTEWAAARELLMQAETIHVTGPAFDRIRAELDKQKTPPPAFGRLVRAIQSVVMEDGYHIPVILIQKEGDLITPERLGKLFERVNINGEVPPQAELFFSALKLRSPQINNYVAEIFNDPELGRILRPVDLILIALRMLDPNIVELQLKQFERQTRDNHARMLELMEPSEGQKSTFNRCLHQVYHVLHHNGESGDIGLPRQMIAGLRPRVWQTLGWWVHENLTQVTSEGISAVTRLDFIRYAVLDSMGYFVANLHGGRHNPRKYTGGHEFDTLPIQVLRDLENFSTQAIWRAIQKKVSAESLQARIPTPDEFARLIRPPEAPNLPNYAGVSGEHVFLQYAQREALRRWEGKDLDVDHIVPSTWFYFRAGKYGINSFWKVADVPYWHRHQVMNSVGNKRYWPESLNCSNKDVPPEQKYIVSNLDLVTDKYHQQNGFFSAAEILAASAIPLEDAYQWANLSNPEDTRVWTTNRYIQFKQVVDQRRIRMYAELYQCLHLEQL